MKEIWIPSPNYTASRGPYNKIVLHTTEGAMTVESLGSWFANPSAGCSSHHGADNVKADTVGAYVYENHKAWTQGNANPYCLSLEMCAYASWSRDKWLNEQGTLLHNAASWVSWMASKYNIPLRVLSNSEAQNPDVRGVCQHKNFGSWGSGHHDCGDGFPMDKVMEWAAAGGASGSGGQPASGGADVASSVVFHNGQPHRACIWATDGKVNYLAPGGSWTGCDPGQKGAKSGGVIALNGTTLVISYVNDAGQVGEYSKPVGSGKWKWAKIGTTNAKLPR